MLFLVRANKVCLILSNLTSLTSFARNYILWPLLPVSLSTTIIVAQRHHLIIILHHKLHLVAVVTSEGELVASYYCHSTPLPD